MHFGACHVTLLPGEFHPFPLHFTPIGLGEPVDSCWALPQISSFYVRKQLLLSARLIAIAILSVRLSVCPSVCHTGGSVKNGAC